MAHQQQFIAQLQRELAEKTTQNMQLQALVAAAKDEFNNAHYQAGELRIKIDKLCLENDQLRAAYQQLQALQREPQSGARLRSAPQPKIALHLGTSNNHRKGRTPLAPPTASNNGGMHAATAQDRGAAHATEVAGSLPASFNVAKATWHSSCVDEDDEEDL